MTSINRFRRWLVVVPLTLFAVLVWDVTSRLIDAEKTAQEQFVRGFEVDASRREGMRDLLGRDVQSALMYRASQPVGYPDPAHQRGACQATHHRI